MESLKFWNDDLNYIESIEIDFPSKNRSSTMSDNGKQESNKVFKLSGQSPGESKVNSAIPRRR